MDELEVLGPIIISIMAAAYRQYIRNKRKRRTHWIKPWIKRRDKYGAHHALLKELEIEDIETYRNFVRMSKENFDELLSLVSPMIKKKDTIMRESITAAERLSLTLRYLASGDSYPSLSYLFRIPISTLSQIIPETCAAIYTCLKNEYMKVLYHFICINYCKFIKRCEQS
ncbi:hypothetical protein FSP39_016061 [Pinctada imbricata]|uniref:Nuclease HARBI1 n=1 Tax=Pinctada imbricata TaxID=66713 RepID=A0AA88YLU6_PINIB|nr:hypothetical protein FSP39_016061 [Pinctada imbricata]